MKLSTADLVKIREISVKYNLTEDEVKEIVMSPYSFIQKKSKEIVFKEGMDKEDFKSMKKNFNIPCLGKLYASNFMYNQIENKKK